MPGSRIGLRGVRVIQRVTVMGDEVEAAEPPRWPAHGSKTVMFWRDTPMRQQLERQRGWRHQTPS